MKTKGIKSGIIQKLFSMAGDDHDKMLFLLKGHFPIYKKKFSVCIEHQWNIAWKMLDAGCSFYHPYLGASYRNRYGVGHAVTPFLYHTATLTAYLFL